MTGAQIAAAARRQNDRDPAPQRQGDAARTAGFVAADVRAPFGVAFLGLGRDHLRLRQGRHPGRLSWDFITSFPSRVIPASAGIQSAIVGTIYLMIICAVFVVPLGVMTAVYLEEYADRDRWFNRFIEVNIQNLAAVPVGRLRHPRPRLHRARPALARAGAAGGRRSRSACSCSRS